MRKWFICPHCGKRLLQYEEDNAKSNGAFVWCKKCKKEIEIKIATQSQ